jgi:hypothetical protein
MQSRRQFFRLSLIALLAVAAERALHRRPAGSPPAGPASAPELAEIPRPEAAQAVAQALAPVWLPLAQGGRRRDAPAPSAAQASTPNQVYLPIARNDLNIDDAPILGRPSGTAQQATDWLAPRAAGYTPNDVAKIVAHYAEIGDAAGIDWFLALAQLAHETASLTSWWSQRPRRNPAGIGVTGRVQPGAPDVAPGAGWTWDGVQWREGLSFATWVDDAIPAQLGRLLAYALTDEQANDTQRTLIDRALAYRPLPDDYRGIAPTIVGLNGRWAVPGTTYGQSIVALARRMRQ